MKAQVNQKIRTYATIGQHVTRLNAGHRGVALPRPGGGCMRPCRSLSAENVDTDGNIQVIGPQFGLWQIFMLSMTKYRE